MASVNVSSFSEFITAIADSSNTVICPNAAVWDMNDIDPLAEIGTIYIQATVTGNNTEIRNFRGRVKIKNGKTVTALHFLDAFTDSDKFFYGSDTSASTGYPQMISCKSSVQLGRDVKIFSDNVTFTSCALNIDFQKSGGLHVFAQTGRVNNCYNRVKINAPNCTDFANTIWCFKDSEFIIDAPRAVYLNNKNEGCTFRGDLAALTTTRADTSGFPLCIINSDGAPLFEYTVEGNIMPVTDAQMRDAAYLHSIGFPIGGA